MISSPTRYSDCDDFAISLEMRRVCFSYDMLSSLEDERLAAV